MQSDQSAITPACRTGGGSSDERLMRAVRANERAAFECLYRRHSPLALRIAGGICQDASRAEEVVQDAFVSIWSARSAYRPTGSFQGWLMRTVRNRALDSIRHDNALKRPRLAGREVVVAERPAPSSLDRVIAGSRRDALRASLADLPTAQSSVIELAFYGGLTHLQIAEQLELPAGTVKGRMRLGLEKLRRQVGRSPEFTEREVSAG